MLPNEACILPNEMMAFHSSVVRALSIVAALALSACSKAPTEILVTINSDLSVPAGLDRILVQSYDTSGASISVGTFPLIATTSPAVNGAYTLPISFAVVPQYGDVSRHAILDVKGYRGSSAALVERKAIMGFESGKKLDLAIFLAQACVSVTCPSDKTCDIGGRCVPIDVSQSAGDAGVDAQINDAANASDMSVPRDASAADAHIVDSGLGDAGIVDASVHDATVIDASSMTIPTYPASPTQTINEPSGGNSHFGLFVAASGDGQTLAALDLSESGTNAPVYIFTRTGTSFRATPTQTLTSPMGVTEFASSSLALSRDGSLLTVGAGSASNGESLVYTRSGSIFETTPVQTISSPSPGIRVFGDSPAFSSDNNTLAIGSANGVFIFERSGGSFETTPTQTISPPSGSAYFGQALALSADASTLVVSDFQFNSVGKVYVYTRSGGVFGTSPTWTISPPPITSSDVSDFGIALALRADGNELVVGDSEGAPASWAFVYERSDSGFDNLVQTISSPAGAAQDFGFGVAISADSTLFIGDGTHVYVYSAE